MTYFSCIFVCAALYTKIGGHCLLLYKSSVTFDNKEFRKIV